MQAAGSNKKCCNPITGVSEYNYADCTALTLACNSELRATGVSQNANEKGEAYGDEHCYYYYYYYSLLLLSILFQLVLLTDALFPFSSLLFRSLAFSLRHNKSHTQKYAIYTYPMGSISNKMSGKVSGNTTNSNIDLTRFCIAAVPHFTPLGGSRPDAAVMACIAVWHQEKEYVIPPPIAVSNAMCPSS